eukprot:m.64008 g.64008  ORF g.64008 m.64008 type:complete len:166 (+) comp23382_c0_seq1:261-758(+)
MYFQFDVSMESIALVDAEESLADILALLVQHRESAKEGTTTVSNLELEQWEVCCSGFDASVEVAEVDLERISAMTRQLELENESIVSRLKSTIAEIHRHKTTLRNVAEKSPWTRPLSPRTSEVTTLMSKLETITQQTNGDDREDVLQQLKQLKAAVTKACLDHRR